MNFAGEDEERGRKEAEKIEQAEKRDFKQTFFSNLYIKNILFRQSTPQEKVNEWIMEECHWIGSCLMFDELLQQNSIIIKKTSNLKK